MNWKQYLWGWFNRAAKKSPVKKRRYISSKQRRSHDGALDSLLDLVEVDFIPLMETAAVWHRAKPTHFRRAEPYVLMEDLRGFSDSPQDGIRTDLNPSDFDGMIDVCMVVGDQDAIEGVEVELVRYRTPTMKEIRGRIITPMPHMLVASYADVSADRSSCKTRKQVFGMAREGVWIEIGKPTTTTSGNGQNLNTYTYGFNTDMEFVSRQIQIAMGVQLRQVMSWTVEIGRDDGPSLLFPTTPAGARAIFKLRDVPEGRKRRAALRTWVDAHQRQRAGSEDETYVRTHLRGGQIFNWNGLTCTLRPSKLEDIANKRLAELRKVVV
jgi:hypothetical protein